MPVTIFIQFHKTGCMTMTCYFFFQNSVIVLPYILIYFDNTDSRFSIGKHSKFLTFMGIYGKKIFMGIYSVFK